MTRRKNLEVWIIMGILTILLSLLGCGTKPGVTGSNGLGKRAKDNESGVVGFYYHYDGTIGGDSFTYQVQKKDDKIMLTYESMEHSDWGEMTKELDEAFLSRLTELYKNCRVAAWEGYRKTNTMVSDGDGFSLSLYFADGKSMSASGMNAHPEGYRDFRDAMNEIFDPVIKELLQEKRQEIIDAGLEGSLTSILAVFMQKGASGSDSYNFLLMDGDIRTNNYDITVHSASGEFFPSGDYRVCRKADDEYLKLEAVQALVEKYDLVRWYDWREASETPNDSEWFQISFGFSGGQTLNAMGTAHPEHYDEFRQDFLSLMAESYQEISALPEE